MSSLLTTPGQTPARVKFLRVVDNSALKHVLTATGNVTAMMTLATFTAAAPAENSASLTIGTLLKDMGKEVVVYDKDSLMHTAIYRLVDHVSTDVTSPVTNAEGDGGTETDGVLTITAPFYVKVWDHNSAGVNVARVG